MIHDDPNVLHPSSHPIEKGHLGSLKKASAEEIESNDVEVW